MKESRCTFIGISPPNLRIRPAFTGLIVGACVFSIGIKSRLLLVRIRRTYTRKHCITSIYLAKVLNLYLCNVVFRGYFGGLDKGTPVGCVFLRDCYLEGDKACTVQLEPKHIEQHISGTRSHGVFT